MLWPVPGRLDHPTVCCVWFTLVIWMLVTSFRSFLFWLDCGASGCMYAVWLRKLWTYRLPWVLAKISKLPSTFRSILILTSFVCIHIFVLIFTIAFDTLFWFSYGRSATGVKISLLPHYLSGLTSTFLFRFANALGPLADEILSLDAAVSLPNRGIFVGYPWQAAGAILPTRAGAVDVELPNRKRPSQCKDCTSYVKRLCTREELLRTRLELSPIRSNTAPVKAELFIDCKETFQPSTSLTLTNTSYMSRFLHWMDDRRF